VGWGEVGGWVGGWVGEVGGWVLVAVGRNKQKKNAWCNISAQQQY
jgi:hypothetical protein